MQPLVPAASLRHPSHMAHEFIVALELTSLGQVFDVVVREGKALAGTSLHTCGRGAAVGAQQQQMIAGSHGNPDVVTASGSLVTPHRMSCFVVT